MKEDSRLDVNVPSGALQKAVKTNRSVLVKVLLWTGRNVNATNWYNYTGLHLASQYNSRDNTKIMKQLLRSGAEVNAVDGRGETPLHVACQSPHRNDQKIVALLMSGANINAKNRLGETPLHMACWARNQHSMEALLRNGAKADVVNNTGFTPLHVVASLGKCKVSLTDILLKRKAFVNAIDSKGMSPLHYLVSRQTPEESLSTILKVFKKGGDVNLQDLKGDTPLHMACERGVREFACLLIHGGAIVGTRNHAGRTPLHLAALSFSVDVVDVLVDYGADVNAQDLFGNTPLHLAFYTKDADSLWRYTTIKKLLEKGAKVDVKNKCSETPYDKCVKAIQPVNSQESQMCPHEFNKRLKIEEAITEHIIKLKTLNVQVEVDIKRKLETRLYTIVQTRCRLELELMRSTVTHEDTPLYRVLSNRSKPYLLSNDGTTKLQKVEDFIRSPNLLQVFPLYGHLLRVTFQRSKMLTLAVQSFYSEKRKRMVKELPYLVTELVVTFLTEEDLRNFIKSENYN